MLNIFVKIYRNTTELNASTYNIENQSRSSIKNNDITQPSGRRYQPIPLPNLKNRKMKSCIKENSKPQETPSNKDPYDYNIDFKGNGLIEKYNQFKHQFGRKYVIKPKERLKVTFKNISKFIYRTSS